MKYQNTLPDNKTKCTICPRYCKLKKGQIGFCSVRENINSDIILKTYGRPIGINIEPVEKKPLYHFYPGSNTLSFGTYGCNMGCLFCQNHHITKTDFKLYENEFVSPQDMVKTAINNNCKSIAYTYNEPIVAFEYVRDTAIIAKNNNIKNILVTSGYVSFQARCELFLNIDATNIDLKSFNKNFYKKICYADLEIVLENIKYVKNETNCHLEITTMLIEGENDSEKEIEDECIWILENLGPYVPIHFTGFYPHFKMLDKAPTSLKTIKKAYNIAKKIGLKYVYGGNINISELSCTFCHNCQKPIINRDLYNVSQLTINNDGTCPFCLVKIPGVFELSDY